MVAVLSGCTPEPEPTPTPTAAFASEEEAFAAAEEVYREYIEAFNAVDLSDPQTFESVESLTTGDYRTDERKQMSELSAEGYTRSGELVLVSFNGIGVEESTVKARSCEDVSAVVIADASGASVVSPDRPDRYALTVSFELVQGSLRIAAVEAVEDPTCVS